MKKLMYGAISCVLEALTPRDPVAGEDGALRCDEAV
jgi:hypothetical protein